MAIGAMALVQKENYEFYVDFRCKDFRPGRILEMGSDASPVLKKHDFA